MAMKLALCGIAVACGIASASDSASGSPTCLGPDGKSVDWWFIFKHHNSLKFTYHSSAASKWESFDDLSVSTSPLSRTVAERTKGNWVAVNDQPPGKDDASETYAHQKALMAFDTSTSPSGFWLTHSWPHFPSFTTSSFYSAASNKYGQSFVCLSLGSSGLNALSEAASISMPYVYASKLSGTAASHVQHLSEWTNVKRANPSSDSKPISFSTAGRHAFKVLAKGGKWGKDIFGDLVAPQFKKGFLVESWQDGRGDLPSYCPPTHPYSVRTIVSVTIGGESWTTHDDHSKWGVSDDASVFCMGDINRQKSQQGRGGTYICMANKALAKTVSSFVSSANKCTRDQDLALVV